MITFKFNYNKKIKKIALNTENININSVYDLVKKFYNFKDNFVLEILDNKNNIITINSNSKFYNYLKNIIRDTNKIPVAKVNIVFKSKITVTNSESSFKSKSFKSYKNSKFQISKKKFKDVLNDSYLNVWSKKDPRYRNIIHSGSNCKICNKIDIRGILYKCMECKNYNLCEDCEYNNHHNNNHYFIRIIENINKYNFNIDNDQIRPILNKNKDILKKLDIYDDNFLKENINSKDKYINKKLIYNNYDNKSKEKIKNIGKKYNNYNKLQKYSINSFIKKLKPEVINNDKNMIKILNSKQDKYNNQSKIKKY